MRCLLIGTVILSATVSCASRSEDYCEAYVIFPSFTTQQRDAIATAAGRWEAFSGRHVELRTGHAMQCAIYPATLRRRGFVGLHNEDSRDIALDPSGDVRELEAAALHELGHAYGMEHVASGVMAAVVRPVAFSADDRAECIRSGACLR